MDYITNECEATEEFIIFFTRLKFYKFREEFGDDCEVPATTQYTDGSSDEKVQKKLRNDYDNRLKGKNLQLYYFYYEIKKLRKENKNVKRINKCLIKQAKKDYEDPAKECGTAT